MKHFLFQKISQEKKLSNICILLKIWLLLRTAAGRLKNISGKNFYNGENKIVFFLILGIVF